VEGGSVVLPGGIDAPFSMTFNPDFKGTPLFDVEYVATIQDD